jgi:hypothetical protein
MLWSSLWGLYWSDYSFQDFQMWVLELSNYESCDFLSSYFPHMSSNRRVSNYKIVTFYDIELHASINAH